MTPPMTQDVEEAVGRLEKVASGQAVTEAYSAWPRPIVTWRGDLRKILSALQRGEGPAEGERERVAAVLAPFAAMATAGDQRPKDDAVWAGQDGKRITYGDFRKARALLSELNGGQDV